jgi:hypothetical protein
VSGGEHTAVVDRDAEAEPERDGLLVADQTRATCNVELKAVSLAG